MMRTAFVDIVFEGAKFSPKALKESSGLRINPLVESGEIAKRGRYKGQKSPYGLATLKIESTTPEDLNIILNSAIKYLILESDLLRKCGVEEVSIDIDSLEGMDIEVSVETYKILAELNNTLKQNYQSQNQVDFTESNVSVNKTDAYILHIYSSFFLKEIQNQFLISSKEDKLKHLFSKILVSNLSHIQVTQEDLLFTVFRYLLKYEDEEFDKVPSFEKVLKASFSNNP